MPRYGLASTVKAGASSRRRTVAAPAHADQHAPLAGADREQPDSPTVASEDGEESTSQPPLEFEDPPGTEEERAALICTLRDEDNFIQNVGQFYNQKEISDIVLKVGEEKFYAHKFVLAKSSEVFRTMLYNRNWTQPGVPEIELEETEECQKHFDTFLKFLYTAEVNINAHSSVGILCLSDKYGVMSLKNLCSHYMVENTRSPMLKNALNWYSWSKALHMMELTQQCSKTIAWNVEFLLQSPEWLEMDVDFVKDLLENSDLVVVSEYNLFLCLKQWLDQDANKDKFLEYSQLLLPLIRFPQMLVHQLYKCEQGGFFEDQSLNSLFLELVNKAYRFRSLCPQQEDPEIEVSFTDRFYEPRNYLDLSVDTVRMQNTLRFGIQVDVRTYVGPVPSLLKEGDWKITYRKSIDTWTLQIYCHESALVGGVAYIRATLIITNQNDRVIQVEESEPTACSRGNHLTMSVRVFHHDQCRNMAVLLKPLAK